MKHHKKKIGQKARPLKEMLRQIDLPQMALGRDESIEICGGNTVTVEGAQGIHTYEREVVKLEMKGYLLAVYGTDFDLDHFGDRCLQLSGKIARIEWEGKE